MIDTYRELSGEAIGSVIVVRNCMSFAIGYGWVLLFLFLLIFFSMDTFDGFDGFDLISI